MVRAIIKPNTTRINLSIPVEYIGEEVEILVFPVKNIFDAEKSVNDTKELSRRQEAFHNFMKYKGTLPDDFDYKKELAEYQNERYGHFN